VLPDCFFGHVEERCNGAEWEIFRLLVQDMRGDLCLSGGIILSDQVGILKELQEVEVILLGMARSDPS
jgi:phosphoribosylformimino-5-aminoimidazole carboxamide ribonucleotide (ProFAR) isomerase